MFHVNPATDSVDDLTGILMYSLCYSPFQYVLSFSGAYFVRSARCFWRCINCGVFGAAFCYIPPYLSFLLLFLSFSFWGVAYIHDMAGCLFWGCRVQGKIHEKYLSKDLGRYIHHKRVKFLSYTHFTGLFSFVSRLLDMIFFCRFACSTGVNLLLVTGLYS